MSFRGRSAFGKTLIKTFFFFWCTYFSYIDFGSNFIFLVKIHMSKNPCLTDKIIVYISVQQRNESVHRIDRWNRNKNRVLYVYISVQTGQQTTNLLLFYHNILDWIYDGNQVDVMYTDFAKTFDRVNHVLLSRNRYK